ncbi:MAG: hypothetical protein XD69_0391, partial [Clostridia bacterium 62_21]
RRLGVRNPHTVTRQAGIGRLDLTVAARQGYDEKVSNPASPAAEAGNGPAIPRKRPRT